MIAVYFLIFWIGLPLILFLGSEWMEIHCPVSLPCIGRISPAGKVFFPLFFLLLLFSVIQFKVYSHNWPVSAYPPDHLIRRGFFAWWRHPIYLFYDATILSLGLALKLSGLVFIVFPLFLILHYLYIRLEEKKLNHRFPELYPYYRKTTGLIFPRLYQLSRIPFSIIFAILYHYRKEIHPLPSPPFFVVSYHNNYLDPFFIGKAIPIPIAFVTTFEMFRKPIRRWIFLHFFCIPKRRMQPDLSAPRRIAEMIRMGGVVGIFPEGERSWTGEPNPFKPEALKLLLHFRHIPIVPVQISGSYESWPRWGRFPRKTTITVKVMPPVFSAQCGNEKELNEMLAVLLKTKKIQLSQSNRLTTDIGLLLYRCPCCSTFESLQVLSPDRFGCRLCRTIFHMKPDYSVEYVYGGCQVSLPLEAIYDKIKIREEEIQCHGDLLVQTDASQPVYAAIHHATLSKEVGKGFQEISRDTLLVGETFILTAKPPTPVIPLQHIRYMVLEGNNRLQMYVYPERTVYQIRLNQGSALRWKDFLMCHINNQFRFKPVER